MHSHRVCQPQAIGHHTKYALSKPSPIFWIQVQTWADQQDQRINGALAAMEAEREEGQRLLDWISSAEEALSLRDQEPLPDSVEQHLEVIAQHMVWFHFSINRNGNMI